MNREIKFRVWNGEQMVSPDYVDRAGYSHWYEDGIPNRSNKLMQFTGLLDKNGKEIYEGDIIKWDFEYDSDYDGDMPIVKRSQGKAEIKDIFDRARIFTAKQEGDGVEVIGNIYENPDLLK